MNSLARLLALRSSGSPAAFAISIGACVYVLLPKSTFYFALSGRYVFENLYEYRDNAEEVHRRLVYDMQRFWDDNDVVMRRLLIAFRIAAAALVVEVLSLLGAISGTIL